LKFNDPILVETFVNFILPGICTFFKTTRIFIMKISQAIREIIVPTAKAHPLPQLLEALDRHLANCKKKSNSPSTVKNGFCAVVAVIFEELTSYACMSSSGVLFGICAL